MRIEDKDSPHLRRKVRAGALVADPGVVAVRRMAEAVEHRRFGGVELGGSGMWVVTVGGVSWRRVTWSFSAG